MITSVPLRAVLFDLDGTLLDSYAAHFQAYQIMFAYYGIDLTPELLRRHYSPDWFQVYRALGLPEAEWERADALWLAAAARHQPALFPGVPGMLARLKSQLQLGLVTSGSGDRVRRDLARTGIGSFFASVVTGDDVMEPKPAPEGLEQALAALGVPAAAALYVGDSPADQEAARVAGVAFVAVPSPFLPDPAGDGPRLAHVAELPRYLARFTGSPPSPAGR